MGCMKGLQRAHVCGCVVVWQARLRGELGALGGEDVFLTHAIQQLQVQYYRTRRSHYTATWHPLISFFKLERP